MFATYPVLARCASQLLLDLRAAQGMPGLELSCGVLVGTSRKECAVQQGTWAGTWMRWGGMQGVTRSQCAGEHLEEILKQGDGQREWKKVGSRRWGIEKGSKGEEKRGVMLPVQMMLLGFSWDQEPGSGGWQNCWANSTWGVKWEQKICWVEPGQGEQAWDEAEHRDPAAMLSLRALPSLHWATNGVRSSCFLWGDRYTSSWGKASGCSKACLGCPLSKHTLCRGPQRRAPGRKEQAPCKPPPAAWLGATMVTTKLLAGGDRQKPLGGCSVMELSLRCLLCCSLSVEAELCPDRPSWLQQYRGVGPRAVWRGPAMGLGSESTSLPALLGLKSCSTPVPLSLLSLLSLPFLSPSPACHSTRFLIIVCAVLWKCSVLYEC